jgi:hypothetical protein
MSTTTTVADKSSAVEKMARAWDVVGPLLEGTTAMREKSTALLPKWPRETPENYAARLSSATLYPAYARTVSTLAGKPFSRPVTLSEDMDEQIKTLLENVDREGRNLDAFSAELLECALGYGMAHILVDYPVAPKTRTKAQEQELSLRPYMVLVRPTQLLGWRIEDTGRLVLLRYMEKVTVDDGDYGAKEIDQIRVLTPGKWELWRKTEDVKQTQGIWTLHASGATTMQDIPFVTVYGRRVGNMVSRPPMMELAHLNVKHWQSQSDQDNIMHIARVPILTVAGVNDTFELVLGSNSAVKLPVGATMAYTEHSGNAIGAGKISLDDLKEEMRQSGAEMMSVRPGPTTRIEAAGDASSSMSDLQRVVLGAEDQLDVAIKYMGQWIGVEKTGNVTLFNDFGVLASAETSASIIMQAGTAGVLSKQTTFDELKRRGMVSPDIDWNDEQERLSEEGPPVGNIDPVTGLPHTKPLAPTAPVDPNAPKPRVDPHTNLPYKEPVQPVPGSPPPKGATPGADGEDGAPGEPAAGPTEAPEKQGQQQIDMTPLVEAMKTMAERMNASGQQPIDLAPLIAAVNARESAQIDTTAIANAVAEAIKSIPPAIVNVAAQPAQVVNVPEIDTTKIAAAVSDAIKAIPATVVNVPQQPAPIVNFTAAPVNVTTPDVNVTIERGGSKSGTMRKQADGSYSMEVVEK